MSLNRGARRKEKKRGGEQMVEHFIFSHSLTSLLHSVPSLIRHGWKSYSQSFILSYLVYVQESKRK